MRLTVKGGSGGLGSLSSSLQGRNNRLKPDGGHGGRGGHVVVVADPGQQTLPWSRPHVIAEKGANGMAQGCRGSHGENAIVRVPCGVVVKRFLDEEDEWDEESKTVIRPSWAERQQEELDKINREDPMNRQRQGEEEDDATDGSESDYLDDDEELERDVQRLLQGFEIDVFPEGSEESIMNMDINTKDRRMVTVVDLDEPGAHVVVARGGESGVGSGNFAKRQNVPSPQILIQRSKAEPGEIAHLELELKLIADVGLVGFPNAGKSSLLHAISRASPKVAPYPFTTLHPILGTVEYRDARKIKVADIPGLIDGASQGRGKGHDFLRHVERTKALCYMVDAAGTDLRDPCEDLQILAQELEAYSDGHLLERRALVVANKLDLLEPEEIPSLLDSVQDTAKRLGIKQEGKVLAISAGVTGQGLPELAQALRRVVDQSEADGLHF